MQRPRPTSLTVFGILNLVFAALGFFAVLLALAAPAIISALPDNDKPPNAVLEIIDENENYATYYYASLVLSLVVSMVLGVAGVGLLMVRPWARYLSIGYVAYKFLSLLVDVAVGLLVLGPALQEKAAQMPPGVEKSAAEFSAATAPFGGCIWLIYPVILLIFMFRPSVIAAMRPQPETDPFGPPPSTFPPPPAAPPPSPPGGPFAQP